jgi:DNA invertase Pin-like site-specific DNA recombinase
MRLGYARVSKEEQADSLPAQVARLRAAGCDRIVEEMESGKVDTRPGLAEVILEVRSGRVAELVITRADRLGRNAAFADELLALCGIQGVKVTAIDGGTIEAASPQGFMQARILTTMAEVESRMLSLRLRKQFEQYRSQGRHLRRRKPFGYRGGANHKLEPHPEHWPQALRVLQRLRQLGSFSAVMRELPSWCEWTPASPNLQAWFYNPCIRGHVGHMLQKGSGKSWRQQWGEIHYDQHPPLIGEGDWQELAMYLRRPSNTFLGRGREARHGLTGLLSCAACGHSLRRNNSGNTAWWRCRHRLCQERGAIKEHDAMPLAVAACVAAADRLAAAYAMPADEDPAVAAKRRDLEQLEGLARRNPAIASACVALRTEIDSLIRRPRVAPELAGYAERISDPEFFAGATPEEQRALFGAVLETLAVGPTGEVRAQPRSW